jgi:hypothetical protein
MSLNYFHPRIATPVLTGRLRILERAPRLDEWRLAQSPVGPVLVGQVVAHPHCGPGLIHTSPVWIVDPAATWALSLSRFYVLGKPAGLKEQVQ